MSSYEKQLINKVVSSKSLDIAIARGITSDHFWNENNKEVWQYLSDYLIKYSDTPPLEKFRKKFPNYEYFIVSEPYEAVQDDFLQDYARKIATSVIRQAAEELKDNPESAMEMAAKFYDMAQVLSKSIPQEKVARLSDMDQRIAEYEHQKVNGTPYGIMTGFTTLDDITLGIQKGDYVTLSAFLGVGKSQMGMYLAYQAYLQDKVAMIITLEMTRKEVFRRLDAYKTSLRYKALKKLELGEGDLEHWRKIAEKTKNDIGDIIVIDKQKNLTVDKVNAYIKQHKPDICIVDYVGLMSVPAAITQDANSYRRVQVITQGLKQVAINEETPIVGIAQLNRQAAKGDVEIEHMADSIAIAQDSDIVLALQQDDEMRKNKVMKVRLLKSRASERTDIFADWDLEKGIIKERSGRHKEATIHKDPENPFREKQDGKEGS